MKDDPQQHVAGVSRWAKSMPEQQRAEALTNAIYGTIIMTAFFAVLEDRVDSAAELLTELLFATLVLFAAHLFASWIGAGAAAERGLSARQILRIIRIQTPLVLVVAGPSLFLVLASAGVFSVGVAISASLAYGVALLFVVTLFLGLHHRRGLARSILYGAIGAGLGVIVIALESALH